MPALWPSMTWSLGTRGSLGLLNHHSIVVSVCIRSWLGGHLDDECILQDVEHLPYLIIPPPTRTPLPPSVHLIFLYTHALSMWSDQFEFYTPVELKIDLWFDIWPFCLKCINYTSDMGQTILFLVPYDQWNILILVLTRYEQLWNLTPCVGGHFYFMQIKHISATGILEDF